MRSKIKQNRYKPEVNDGGAAVLDSGTTIDVFLKWIMLVAGISVLSLVSIFAYDLVTQSPLFNVKKIDISGNNRVLADEIIAFANLDEPHNIYKLNLYSLEKRIADHPWIESASVKRNFSSKLSIAVVEHEPLAIVKIENMADIIINTQGRPFKEYDPTTDHLDTLPVITGLDLTRADTQYIYDGILINAIMNFLKVADVDMAVSINAHKQMGITIEARDIFNKVKLDNETTIPIKMGFGDYKIKLKKAKTISEYIDKNFPEKTIIAMDLFNLQKVFIKTTLNQTGLNTIKKGV
ncbi:MAG: FtsQ-type POTRA domain-containing protein [Desulfobacula sp.]|nr:FtsQ-type POTRA domain-containing protein [Desulfobacula sp.]